MNGFKIMAESYKKALEEGHINEEEAAKNIKVYGILSELTKEELYIMVDSTAFNEIIKSYCRTAIRQAEVDTGNGGLNERTIENKIMSELDFLFNDRQAAEICS